MGVTRAQTRSQTKSQTTTPSPASAPRDSSSQKSPWRCEKGERLHREGTNCTADTPPTDPIIDTPAKRARVLRQSNVPMINSQPTQPTPSGPPRHRPQTEDNQIDAEEVSQSPANVQQVDDDTGLPNHHEREQTPSHLSRTPVHDPTERIPETPLSSSPRLPSLTAENLSLLAAQNTTPDSATSNGADDNGDLPASALAPAAMSSPNGPNNHNRQNIAASIHSRTSSVRALIIRHALRARINGEQFEAANRALERVSARCRAWRNALIALVVLILAYLCWCYYNSADFEYINNCRRDWYGL